MGDIELTREDVEAIDKAGAKGQLWDERKAAALGVGKWVALAGFASYAAFRAFLQ